MITIQEFLKSINKNAVVRENLPLGLGMSYPMLSIVGDHLLVSVFYYKAQIRPEDKTLLMPPEYMMTFEYPSGKLVSLSNLQLDARFAKVTFDKAVGMFRHEAIKHLKFEEYKEKKEAL